ncbi:MAG TPA: S8 family serine peptidase [Flavobacterium sp.]|nr:S8 family serine peptidase [Flavobacterium sp.]
MKLKLTIFILFLTTFSYSQELEFSNNEVIVEFNSKRAKKNIKTFKKDDKLKQLNDSLNLESFNLIGNKKQGKTFILKFKHAIDVIKAIQLYKNTGLFRYAEPNYIGKGHGMMQTNPNDPFFSNNQWSHQNNGTFSLSTATTDADIDSDLAWDITQGDPNLIVAILDSGLKLDHPEFSGRIVAGYDYANNDTNPTDDQGHGTNVAGIALAKGNNSIGYAGVNWNSKVMPVKILDNNNSGFYTWWADGIYYAVDNGAKVINMSVGGNSPSTLLEDAINYAHTNNVSIVVSTGNQNSTIQYPAKYNNAIAVGSTNPNDVRTVPFFWSATSGSNFGTEIDFVAPGNYIFGLSYTSNTNYNTYWGGTSQAAPHVAGVISLLLSVNPNLTVTQIRQVLQETSQDMVGNSLDTSGWDQYYGHGRLNANNALSHFLLSTSDYFIETKNIKAYPNPVNQENELNISGLINGNHYTIKLVSLDGKNILEKNNLYPDGNVKLDLNNFQTGVYFLNIYNLTTKTFISKKIIKK